MRPRTELILWIGAKHSGKTTRAAKLVEHLRKEEFDVAGVLAPSLYVDRKLMGFDAIDLQNGRRAPLMRLQGEVGNRGYETIEGGLELGRAALDRAATESTDLIIVDEFGPLELKGHIWRKNVDSILTREEKKVLLVVRRGLCKKVRQLYMNNPCHELEALEPESIGSVISMLKSHRGKRDVAD